MFKQYIRWQENNIIHGLKTIRVLHLAGPRQCGKTTLAKKLASEDVEYRTLDDNIMLEAAIKDPQKFVKHYQGNAMIIDEIQRAPVLLMAIKKVVDEDTRNGQYLLTGSADIHAVPSTKESLAGRIGKIRLRPLTQGEILGIRTPEFINLAFEEKYNMAQICDDDTILDIAFRGGYPEAVKLDGKDRKIWHKRYINALLERDLIDIARIQHKDAMEKLVEILATWSSKFMDISAIGSGLSIQRPTLESYINALEALYLIERVHPWSKTDYDRVGKQDKLFMTDSGLMSSILNWRTADIRFDGDKIGKLIETFVFNELSAQIEVTEGEYQLFHYRDRLKREIDFLIERDDGALLGIEVKASSSVTGSDFKHLTWFKENMTKGRKFKGVVLYAGGQAPLSFGEDMMAVPLTYLWS